MTIAEVLAAGIAEHRAGQVGRAETIYRHILALLPDCAPALYVLGLLALGTGRAGEAAGLLARACAARPGHSGQVLALARAWLASGRVEKVLPLLKPLRTDPELPAASRAERDFLRGCALNAPGPRPCPAEAAEAFRAALAIEPGHAAAHANLGNALADLDQPDAAEAAVREALRLDAGMAEARASLAHLLIGRGALAEAVAECDRAIALSPDLPAAHWNRGIALLLAGRFAEGWRGYEWRRRRFPEAFTTPPGEPWGGEDLGGKRLLVLGEQGTGDAIQMARYLPLLAGRGARVHLRCDPRLHVLLRQVPGLELGDVSANLPPHDAWVDQMSLPRLFGTTASTVPSPGAYLRADKALVEAWRERLPPNRRIGVVWAGNPAHSNDRHRSMPPDAVAALAEAAGPNLVGLQVGARMGEMARRGVPEFGQELHTYAETAALLRALDLLVTVDTAAAHLAGALGVPCLLMLPAAPDWRWMLNRDDTPWYARTRLVRQASPGEWGGVVGRVAAILAEGQFTPAATRVRDGAGATSCLSK